MRLREVFTYELGYRFRSPSTWAYGAFLFALGFLIVNVSHSETVHINAPAKIADMEAMFTGLFGMLVTAGIFGDAAVRDTDAGMDPLLYTSRLTKTEYLVGRYLAALCCNAILLLASPIAIALATLMPNLDQSQLGPFRLMAFVQPYVLFMLPNIAIAGAFLFTIGSLVRQSIPVYLGAAGLFVGYISAANYWSSIASPTTSILVDALGINALREMTMLWPPAEQNTRLIGFPGVMVLNRVIWLAVAAGVLGLLHRRFRFAHADGGRRKRDRKRELVEARSAYDAPVAIPRVAGVFGAGTHVRQVLAVTRRSFEEVLASRWFVVAMAASVGIVLLMGWNVGSTVFDTSTWPMTFLVVEEVLGRRVLMVAWILTAVYAGELVWTERESGTSEIADAVPLPDGSALLGRYLTLVLMLVAFHVAFIVGGVLLQTVQGYSKYDLGLYLRAVFGLSLPHYMLLAALAMTVHVLVNHKYFGHIVVLGCFVFAMVAPQLGLRHHLLVYATNPGWTYSSMNGFGPFIGPIVWFKLYWAAWALLLGVVGCLFWIRGREPGITRRFTQAGARLVGPMARTAVVAALLIVSLGGFIFYNTNVLNDYRSPDQQGATEAEYEKRYKRFENVPQPTVEAADMRAELYPEQSRLELKGTFSLVNSTSTAIDSVHVYSEPDVQVRSMTFDRTSKPVVVDSALGYRIFALEHSLAPGDSLHFTFDVAYGQRGFSNGPRQTRVTGNGSTFNRRYAPFIGYQPMVELSGSARQRFGLAPQPPMPAPNDSAALRRRDNVRNEYLVQTRMTIGTVADQIAITPGILRRTWTERGRRYFEYETDRPTAFGIASFSARYEVVKDRWNDVELRIYHIGAQPDVLERTMKSMKASLAYYTEHFGPYPDKRLQIVEYPRYGGFGSAHPQTIAFSEDYFLSRVNDGEIDQPFFGTAHETAHQWWPGQARGALVRGRDFLGEALANYSAMMVVEKTYGADVARRVYGFQMEKYLSGRAARSREVSVLDVEDQAYLSYRKGAVALYHLRQRIGEDSINAALHRYLERFRDAPPPYPTSRDLYAELRAVTPEVLRPMLKDWFEHVVLWDVKTQSATTERLPNGEYQVTLDVVAKKVRADSVGNESEIPMEDLIDIGVFAAGKNGEPGAPLYLIPHSIRSGAQTLVFTVSQKPARAGVDPYRWLIDRNGDDNVVAVKDR